MSHAQKKILGRFFTTTIKFEEDSENVIKQEPPDLEDDDIDINLMKSYVVEAIMNDPIPSTSSKRFYSKHKSRSSSKKKSIKKDHFCPVCDKYFTEARKVKTHVERIHEKKKNFACDRCEYKAFKK